MMDNTPAQLFLADQRGLAESDTFRRQYTFNFEAYQAEGRAPFGSLYLFNNEVIDPAVSLTMTADQSATVILLPLVGGLAYQISGTEQFLEPGQAGALPIGAGQSYSVLNPYGTETINWLQIGLQQPATGPLAELVTFELSQKNHLLPCITRRDGEAIGYMGLFDGRQEGTYSVEPAADGQRLFVYIVQGAFEVANRLMHSGDGLALHYQQADTLEFEALSNNAMLLLLAL